MNNQLRINLGSGTKKREGFTNIDINPKANPDICIDAFEYLRSLDSDSVDYIFSQQYLEHIEPQNYIPFLEEMYRVSKDKAVWEFILPFANFSNLHSIPTHYRAYSYNHFLTFYVNSRDNYSDINLRPLYKEPNILVQLFFQTFPYLKRDIYFKLEVIKE